MIASVQDAQSRARRRAVLSAAAVVSVTLALYWPAREAGFVGDDFMILHRLRGLSGLSGAGRFFGQGFFEYYRPLGFLSHAVDWAVGGADPRQFHLTNVLLHAINAVLVLLIAQTLATRSRRPGAVAGLVASLLFALHPSNQEAVVWVSARFDVLATCWSLVAVLWMVAQMPGSGWMPAVLFLPAILSKESAVALPIAAAAWAAFCLGATTTQTMRRVAPWLMALGGYGLLRWMASLHAAGGPARMPKLFVLCATLVFVVACAGGRWTRLRDYLLAHSRLVGALVAAGVTASVALPVMLGKEGIGELARDKLAVAGFALTYLVTPLSRVGQGAGDLRPLDDIYRSAALAGLPVLAIVGWALRRRLVNDPCAWFLGATLFATLLPISALTEGRRYLYLPSAIVSIGVGLLLVQLRSHWQALGTGVVATLLAISAVRIHVDLRDWTWAGAMTAEGARLVDAALAPGCNTGHVVFLTSPVGVRGVYTHFYYETFELPRGCAPRTFQVLSRVVRVDARVDAQWMVPDRIVLTVPEYRGNLVLSPDLRHFDRPLDARRPDTVRTPIGELRAEALENSERLTLTLADADGREAPVFFYYSDGRIRQLSGPSNLDGRGRQTLRTK